MTSRKNRELLANNVEEHKNVSNNVITDWANVSSVTESTWKGMGLTKKCIAFKKYFQFLPRIKDNKNVCKKT